MLLLCISKFFLKRNKHLFKPLIHSIMTAPNKRLLGIIAAIPFLLLIPLVAMQFTTDVDWDAFDFAVMGALLLLTGFGIELALRIIKEWKHRLIAVGIILLL